MKKRFFFVGALSLMLCCGINAQELNLQPTPQEYIQQSGLITLPESYRLVMDDGIRRTPAALLMANVLPDVADNAQFKIILGIKGDKSVRKVGKRIPAQTEGYFLKISENGIVLAGADRRGLYYGAQTLSQLLKRGRLPLIEITDYPDLPYRGVVEGFYGTPWSHEARLRQLEFYGRNKLNVYIYGPKDDPYHSVPNWRKPYPAKEAAQLKELVDKANENEVMFYWAIHPGQDIKWNTEDRDLLLEKFEGMYQLGVRAFAVFFDDISGEGTKAVKQAELLNYIDDHFVKVKGDVAPLIMCPTEYNKSWSNVKGGYLPTLGDKLNKGIEIMWTGDRVIACIDKQSMDFINPLLKRKAYIWWNFPVSDYVRDHLLMGPVYGNGLDIKDEMSAFVSNPMERPEASKIALYSVADYAWNLESYDSEASWHRAISDLMPESAAYLETFATHNSDLGVNGHGFRREETVALTPQLKSLLDSYKKDGRIDREAYRKVFDECNRMILSADMLLASTENRNLTTEIRPWLIQFKLLGEYGKVVLQMVRSQLAGNQEAFVRDHAHAQALQSQMYEVDATYNQNPYQPGVKTGSKSLVPAFQGLFETATVHYNSVEGTSLDAHAVYIPYTLNSDVKQLALLPMRQKGKSGSVSPSNEVILWQAGGQLTVEMDYARVLNYLVLDLGIKGAERHFQLEVTEDGVNWTEVAMIPTGRKTQLGTAVEGLRVLKVRLKNVSDTEQEVYFRQFAFGE